MASISWPPNEAPSAMLECVRDTEPHSHTEEDTRGHLAGSALSLRKCKIVFFLIDPSPMPNSLW